ncbi:hypothetical protein EV189_1487 [Motilibacter rhizosphaerae]|uniref:Transcriptional regulator, AbiEi antitoxin, Type IV TA system n=1 Tax=Motilibacter rhizosphaerae TaxID=598652 RepID=A0A4Q7NS10_9ACTN|nr:hypothetical protein [Motilibacter rhizosphaerae]RZS89714.1 hypothetical protein EV189_1487 [Motilibacter rhizosphaerae]
MPRRSLRTDSALIADLAEHRDGVTTLAELAQMGIAAPTAVGRCRPGGPWQSPLPGVVVLHSGRPSQGQLERAALAYAGDGSALTGIAALRRAGVPRLPPPEPIRVLVPHEHRRQSRRFVVVERTRRMPEDLDVVRGLPCAPPARALVDECRQLHAPAEVRALVAAAVQSSVCSVSELREEHAAAANRRKALMAMVLAEVGAGVRSVAEGDARRVVLRSGLPQPLWNVDLLDQHGRFLARPDAWWDELAVALEIDSVEWHISPSDYLRTQDRQRRLTELGVLVVPVAPGEVRRRPQALVEQLRRTLAAAALRPRPAVQVVTRAAA